MKLTKFVHSCVLIEHERGNVLVDPGMFADHVLDKVKLPELAAVLITHIHPDHYHSSLIKRIQSKQPDIQLVSNDEVLAQMERDGLKNGTKQIEGVDSTTAEHARVLGETVQNTVFDIYDTATHPGDTHDLTETKDILLLPVTAPWGSMVEAVDLALKLKPKTVVPIHDGMWTDMFRTWMYSGIEKTLSDAGIDFTKIEPGGSVEL